MFNPEEKFEEPQISGETALDAIPAQNVTPDAGLPHGIFAGPEGGLKPKKTIDSVRLAEIERRRAELQASISGYKRQAENAEAVKKANIEARRRKGQENLPMEQKNANLNFEVGRLAKQKIENGWPIGNDGRFDIDKFKDKPNYNSVVVERDKEIIAKLDQKFGLTESGNDSGERAEKMFFVLGSEFFPKCDFIRASKTDDEDMESDRLDGLFFAEGKLVCAFDIISTAWNKKRADEKEDKTGLQNGLGGAGVKYCCENDGSGMRYEPEIAVPVFNVRVDPNSINKISSNFSSDDKDCKTVMYEIADQIYGQIEDLEERLEDGGIKFDQELSEEEIFTKRLAVLKNQFSEVMPREIVEKHLAKPEFTITRRSHFE